MQRGRGSPIWRNGLRWKECSLPQSQKKVRVLCALSARRKVRQTTIPYVRARGVVVGLRRKILPARYLCRHASRLTKLANSSLLRIATILHFFPILSPCAILHATFHLATRDGQWTEGRQSILDKGKPVARRGRKAMGLPRDFGGCQVTERISP